MQRLLTGILALVILMFTAWKCLEIKDKCFTIEVKQNYGEHKQGDSEALDEKKADEKKHKENESFHAETFDLQAVQTTHFC